MRRDEDNGPGELHTCIRHRPTVHGWKRARFVDREAAMRLKELRGLPVIDPTAARKVGNVTDYQVDPVSGRIAALDITCVDDNESVRILAPRIRRVGHNAVILTARGGAAANAPVE